VSFLVVRKMGRVGLGRVRNSECNGKSEGLAILKSTKPSL
jgi:hypothetical protein